MIPGAPWHHCNRISPRVFSKRSRRFGRPVREIVLHDCGAFEDHRGTSHERRPTLPVEKRRRAPGRFRRGRAPGRGSASRARGAAGSTARRNRGAQERRRRSRPRPLATAALLSNASMSRAAMRVPGAPHMISSASLWMFSRTRAWSVSASSALGAARYATRRIPVSPAEERRLPGLRKVGPASQVGPRSLPFEDAQSEMAQIESRLACPRSRRSAERPQDARRAAVEVLQRARRPPAIPCLRGPEELWTSQRGIRVLDDLADPVTDAGHVPRLFDERLEVLRPVEHSSG